MTDNDVTAFHVAVELYDALLDLAIENPLSDKAEETRLANLALEKHEDRIATYRNIVTRWGEKGKVDD